MLICNGDTAYKCSGISRFKVGSLNCIHFFILEPVTHTELAILFTGNTFYFYDDALNERLTDTDDTKLVGLSITYNADSTYNIIIKLKGDVDNDEG